VTVREKLTMLKCEISKQKKTIQIWIVYINQALILIQKIKILLGSILSSVNTWR